ncbi:MAG: diaminopimelate epimerase [Gammaproteobacteria bacterium]|nr:diaminopimelate epimerase [Gammaproteobacteria bacterium]
MKLEFTKMHGLGNDFMIIRWPDGMALPSKDIVRRLADRRIGIGFDQLLVLLTPIQSGVAVYYRIFNSDGSEVEQCGNGARCIAWHLAAKSGSSELVLESMAGIVEAKIQSDDTVAINLGKPNFMPRALPFLTDTESDRYLLELENESIEIGAVSMGNPHAIIQVDSVDKAPVGILGPELQAHAFFPQSINIGFVEFLDSHNLKLRVFERGVGETRACGTGAAAAVAVGRRWGRLDADVQVELMGGTLKVQWLGPGHSLWLSGPVTKVYEGHIEL